MTVTDNEAADKLYRLSGRFEEYDLDSLLRLLPAVTLTKYADGSYTAEWVDHPTQNRIVAHSRTNPANVLCRLAVRLYERGILPRAS